MSATPATPVRPPEPKCIAFRRFREKHIELSEIYWQHVIGSQVVARVLRSAKDGDLAVSALGISTKQTEWGFTAKETLQSTGAYLDRVRLHLLAICCANLEAFLKDVAFCHVLSLGYKDAPGKLSPSGKALGSPILDRASLPEPLKYAEHLFSISYGAHLARLKRAYLYRCALVHNGGVVLPRTISELSLAPTRLHTRLGYSWADLKAVLESAFEVARTTGRKVSSYNFRLQEVERELCYLKETATLPKDSEVWKYFHDQGFALPRKADRIATLRSVKAS